jgi:acyl carrier protein
MYKRMPTRVSSEQLSLRQSLLKSKGRLQVDEAIRKFLVTHRANPGAAEIQDEESLLEQGVIDSATMMDLITFLESHFNIRIDDDELTPENFDSVTAIAAFVRGKSGDQQPAASPTIK